VRNKKIEAEFSLNTELLNNIMAQDDNQILINQALF